MAKKILTDSAIEAMRSDNTLLAEVANALNISILTIPGMLQKKSRRFVEQPALKLIAKALNCSMDELLIDEDTKVTA